MLNLYDRVRTIKPIITEENASIDNPSTIKTGSIGYIVEDLGNECYLVEFDYKVYKDPVVGCKKTDIELV